MLSPLRNRFGIPGVISVIALVFAMFGGAYAASDNGGSGSKASASAKKAKKAKKGPRGPRGPKGPAGPQGPVGPAGAKGDTGAAGSNGKDGSNGSNGTNGTSATTATFAGAKGSCSEGGVEVESASPDVLVCNGVKGQDGETGFTSTLPSGATETGTWSAITESETFAPISFSIPLKEPLPLAKVHIAPDANCPGTVLTPQAAAGHLCVYVGFISEVAGNPTVEFPLGGPSKPDSSFEAGAGVSGAMLYTAGSGAAFGSFAVTGAP